jgi:hypothetical protein
LQPSLDRSCGGRKGVICGANDVKAIWHKCGPLDQNQRRAIGLTKRNKKTALIITTNGGDYLLGLKDNQPTLHKRAQQKLAEVPDEWVSEWEKDHGRTERRRVARVEIAEQISSFPGAKQFVRIIREWKENGSDELKSEMRYFITSLEKEERSAPQLGQAIRGHWSAENKNHWKRDTSLWKEDASRSRKKRSGGQVLALLRGAVLRLHDMECFESLNASFNHHSAKPWSALRLLKTPPPAIN